MFCTTCGAQIRMGNAYCDNCGRPAMAAATPQAAAAVGPAPTFAVVETEPKAVWSVVLGILSITMFSILAGIPAIVLGHMARARIAQSMGRLQGAGMAMAGLIMGYISLAVIPFILIIAAIAIPNLLQSRVVANQSSAVSNVREIVYAAEAYYAMYPQVGYPARLSDLGGKGMEPSESNAGMIEETLAAGGPVGGYVFYYESFDAEGDGVRESFFVRADPSSPARSGGRSYCAVSGGPMRVENDGECTPESPQLD